jgi:general secretion pathway protein K
MSARRRNERGLVLIVVLWGIAALSLIAAAILSSAATSVRVSRNVWSQLRVQAAADAGAQAAALSLFDPSPSGTPALDGRERHLSFDDVGLTVSVRDQSGLIDINTAGSELLRSYFRAQGMADDEAHALAARVIAWRSPRGLEDSIATGVNDEGEGSGYGPRRGPFQSLDELTFVRGVTPDIYRRLESGLTIYSHRPDFDTRTAPKEVLALIPGMTAARAEAMIAGRPPVLPQAGHAYLVEASAERDGVRFTRRAVFLRSADPARPFWILDWR